MKTKYCPRCKRRRRLTAFGIKSAREWAGLQTYCRECHNAKMRERTRKYPELVRRQKRDYMRRARANPEKAAILREQNAAYMRRWYAELKTHPKAYRVFLKKKAGENRRYRERRSG